MKTKIIGLIQWCFQRNIFLYGVVCCVWLLLGGHKAWLNAHLRSFNRTAPDFSVLVEFMINGRPVSTDKWQEALRYYANIRRFFPEIEGASGFEGICYFYLGDDDGAVKSLAYAVEHTPQIAVFRYDLAVLYFNEKHYMQAAETLSPIFSADQSVLIQAMIQNNFLKQIFSRYPTEIPLEQMWSDFMRQVSVLLIKSYYLAGDYEQASGAARYGLMFGAPLDEGVCGFAAEAALKTRQIDLALEYVEEGIKKNPDDPLLFELLSNIFTQLGQNENAFRALAAAKAKRMRGFQSHSMDIIKENLRFF